MKTKQTNLQKIVARAADYLQKHIEAAVESGAPIENGTSDIGAFIDGVYVARSQENTVAVVVYMESETIAKVLQPSEAELKERAEKLRAELQEIESKLNK